jgi:tetratricopeptide (TPR) repeat protein
VPELEGLPRLWKPFPELSVVDVNGDGRPDLLAVADGCFVADLGGTVLRHMLDFEDCTLIKAGDLDGDHRPELVMVNHGLRVVHVARDWSTQQSLLDDLAIDESHVTGIDIADLDGDGRAELVYAGSMWTRYDVRVARVDHGALRMIARGQVGAVLGLTAMDIEGGRGIFAVKSHSFPSPRLFEDDPYLGPSGPMILRLAGGHLERVWFDPLVPATAPAMELKLVAGGRRTRLGPAFVVDSAGGVLHLYFGPGIHPIRRDLRHLGAANLADGGVVIADLDGDGDGELVLGGARVAAYGIGPGRVSPRREHRRTGADWVSIADELRDAGQLELALSAYRAAVAHGADPVVVAFEEGVCLAKAERWDLALARFRDARTGGRHDTPLWRAMLEAAEATADWPAALDVARALGDTARAARIEKLTEFRTAFVQDFVEPWPAWRVEQPLACRGRTADGALGLSLLPADRGLALPIEWDGSSMEVSAVVALRDVQYAKSIDIDLARDDGQWAVAGEVGGLGGGGELQVHAYIRSPPDRRLPAGLVTPFNVDWSVFPERVKVSLSYIDHIAQWQIAIHDLAGKRLHHAMVRATSRPIPGRYVIRMLCPTAQFLSASIIDLYRFEIRAAPGALRVIPPAASDPPPRCARDLAPASASSPLHRAFALAAAGKIAAAARELAAWRPSASSRPYPDVFELDQYHVSEWEAGLARLALLDEPLASAIVETGKLMPRREWGVLLRRLAYQQDIDSGQTHWREGVLALRHAVAFAPDDPDAWYMLGYCHYRLGGLAAARSAFERAVELAPAIEGRYPKQGGPAILLALITAREHDAGAAARWLKHAARYGGNLDIARRDPTLRELLRGQLPEIVGH